MIPNFLVVFLTALVPLFTGFIWYNQKVFGKAWIKASGVNMEEGKKMNMALIFGLTYVFSVLLTLMTFSLVVHQTHVYSILVGTPGFGQENSEVMNYLEEFMGKYGENHRSFGHGLTHGGFAGFLIVLPVITVNALFEMKGFRYIAINAGFWIVNLMIMGGIVCAFA